MVRCQTENDLLRRGIPIDSFEVAGCPREGASHEHFLIHGVPIDADGGRGRRISAAGLRHFLKGGTPYHRTARKLMAWYARHGRELPGLSADVVEAALTTLAESVPEEARPAAREMIVEAVRSACVRHGHRPPAWTEAYRADPRPDPRPEAEPVPGTG
jgi:hypothetical protein